MTSRPLHWTPSTNSAGYGGDVPENEYPSREFALALITALESDDWDRPYMLSKLVGVDDFSVWAERAFKVYGYPQLEAGNVCRRMLEVSMRPTKQSPTAGHTGPAGCTNGSPATTTPAAPSASPEGPERVTYGLTPRQA